MTRNGVVARRRHGSGGRGASAGAGRWQRIREGPAAASPARPRSATSTAHRRPTPNPPPHSSTPSASRTSRSCWSFNALGALEGPPGRTTLPLASWSCSPSSSSSIVTMRRLWSGYEETPVAWRPDQQQAPTYQVISCSRSHQAQLGTMIFGEVH